jgi:hypothetical protein
VKKRGYGNAYLRGFREQKEYNSNGDAMVPFPLKPLRVYSTPLKGDADMVRAPDYRVIYKRSHAALLGIIGNPILTWLLNVSF